MAAKSTKKNNQRKITSVLAQQDDGTLQLTITIPYSLVKDKREEALNHLAKDLEIPGFRKGKAPRDVALKHIEQQQLFNHTLQHLLPEAYAQAVEEHKLQPILAPRFELVKIEEGDDWVVRAITCELPEVNLGNYKKSVVGRMRSSSIWTPKTGDKRKPTREEKEQEAIKALLEEIKVKIPKLLLEEEVNHRLSQLLDQVQRLGLTIEKYLASTGKTIDQVKQDFTRQAGDAIKLELSLNKVAEEEAVQVEDKEVEEVINQSGSEQARKTLSTPQQKRLIRSVLLRRKALESLVNLS